MQNSYVRRQDQTILNLDGEPFTLKGVGIGGWLLFEGYIFKSFAEIDRQWRFEQLLDNTLTPPKKVEFLNTLRANFFSIEDIILIKKSGFNSIRIPLDYQFLFEASNEHVELTKRTDNWLFLDSIIEKCTHHQVLVILDLHAAPGGQNGTNIDNSKYNIPELFTNEQYRKQTIYVWREIARRYRDVPSIACYDLLNEPLPKRFVEYRSHLVPLYKDIITSIRTIDPHHMLSIQGPLWATDFSLFDEVLDQNIILQFHKYWNTPDMESLRPYLVKREALNLPLFMGEGGENNNQWYAAVFKLYDQLNISYNFWTYKKMETKNSIISFAKPKHWDEFINNDLNDKDAELCLNELLINVKYSNSDINQNVINHIQRRNKFTSPGYAFDFLSSAYSSKTPKKSSIRNKTNIAIVNKHGAIIPPNFKQYSGGNVPALYKLYLKLLPHEWVEYTLYTDNCIKGTIFVDVNQVQNIKLFFNENEIHSLNRCFNGTSQKNKNILRIYAINECLIDAIKFDFNVVYA